MYSKFIIETFQLESFLSIDNSNLVAVGVSIINPAEFNETKKIIHPKTFGKRQRIQSLTEPGKDDL